MDEFETSAFAFHRTKRDYEYAFGKKRLELREKNLSDEKKKPFTSTDLDNATIVALYGDPSYKALVIAESTYEGCKAAIKVLEARSVIGTSLLRSARLPQ